MKQVRFQTPGKAFECLNMSQRECHSPRPFIERRSLAKEPDVYNISKVLPYSNDPVQLYESSNSSPYPTLSKTKVQSQDNVLNVSPSSDLELSILDSSCYEPCRPVFSKSILKPPENCEMLTNIHHPQLLSSSENKPVNLPNVLVKDNDFFIKRNNLVKFNFDPNPMHQKLKKISFDKENDPFLVKPDIANRAKIAIPENRNVNIKPQVESCSNRDCNCHHCKKDVFLPDLNNISCEDVVPHHQMNYTQHVTQNITKHHCPCGIPPPQPPPPSRCVCCNHGPPQEMHNHHQPSPEQTTPKMNAVDKKTWAIEKYEQSKKPDTMEVEKQTNISKEKREPTVSDLIKIIKLQNEQIQLLQEKVDKFITTSQQKQPVPLQAFASDQVVINSTANNQQKISIGVMTSFEVVRTSTIINQEVLKTNENAQIQCNRSQISIKEVFSKPQSPNLNFLEGISPASNNVQQDTQKNIHMYTNADQNVVANEEKTLNELSLCNVQVDTTTPLMSPEQSLYLDLRDYSDSDDENNQSNVGWTYYNKVMTHVNGMLQDSDMPSSASAMYRNTRQHMQTVQMQIDKTNVSVMKRVKFGDDPLGIHQPHIYPGSTDTSMKMNQLAAKYLNRAPIPAQRPARPSTAPIDMSFATRNYMERHRLLQGTSSKSPQPGEIPKFLDITALKQQPKFL